ncbi:MAG: hypothetical protein OXH09_22835 [Gammaproteobacteria bacterium]|nr:hypothetical protein [Gammaproteobacteria bacterium]
MRETVAPLLGLSVEAYGCDRTTYDPRRPQLNGLVEHIPSTRRYRITTKDQRIAPFYTRSSGSAPGDVHGVRRAVESFDHEEVQHLWKG